MATMGPLIEDGSQNVAGSDLSAKQFYAVKLTGSRTLDLASTGGEDIYGILQNKPTLGQSVDAGFLGVSKAVAGAAITAGDKLMTDTSGRVITATAGNFVIGEAIEAASGASIIITMMVRPGGKI